MAEAQINASEAAGGGAPAISSTATAPGTLGVFAGVTGELPEPRPSATHRESGVTVSHSSLNEMLS